MVGVGIYIYISTEKKSLQNNIFICYKKNPFIFFFLNHVSVHSVQLNSIQENPQIVPDQKEFFVFHD